MRCAGFLAKLRHILQIEQALSKYNNLEVAQLTLAPLSAAKKNGFSDRQIARCLSTPSRLVSDLQVRKHRQSLGLRPWVKQIDTLSAEFPAQTNYLYMTYNGCEHDLTFDAAGVMVLGCGAYRIGSSCEFDWCAVSCLRTLRQQGFQSVMVNFNPETVSTDYDECDRLYFEELSFEVVMDIYECERSQGIILSVGGQIPNNLAIPLSKQSVNILGTSAASIDQAEDREKFSELMDRIGVDQAPWKKLSSPEQAIAFAESVGFPVLVRPSYVLSGAAMNVAENGKELRGFLQQAVRLNDDQPVVISKFIVNAKEIEYDGVAKQGAIVNFAISEHIENAGVHSGDATLLLPAQKLYVETIKRIKKISAKIAAALRISGPFNIQFLSKNNDIKVIECNLRASRSLPFVSKTFNVNFVELATRIIVGAPFKASRIELMDVDHCCVTGDHMVLTRSGWQSIVVIHRQFQAARAQGVDAVIEVSTFNTTTSAMEWKRVDDTQCYPVETQRLFRMQNTGMDVVATGDHRMLTGKRLGAALKLSEGSFAYDQAAQLEREQYRLGNKSSRTAFEHHISRVVVRCGVNRQPAYQFVIPGLERVCARWWQMDQQLGFLRLLGFWLGDGHLVVNDGYVAVSQRKLESTAWLIDLLDEVFPRWWRRNRGTPDDAGLTFVYLIRCPPLYEWLRVMGAGPAGYNPLDPAALRDYPHFDYDAAVARAEAASKYAARTAASTWTEGAMLAAFKKGPRRRTCCVCGVASGVRLSCSGTRCHPVDAITRAHPGCVGRTAEEAFARLQRAAKVNRRKDWAWFCGHAECQAEAVAWAAAHPHATASTSSARKRPHPAEDSVGGDSGAAEISDVVDLADEEQAPVTVVDAVALVPVTQVAAVQAMATGIVWNNGVWDIDADGHWFYRKRWLGPNAAVAATFANLSRPQAVALLEGFNRADGTSGLVKFNAQGEPTGQWYCTNSSMPLIQHLQLIGQLAGARVDLSRIYKAGKKSKGIDGRTLTHVVDHWALALQFTKVYGAKNSVVSLLAKPVDVSADVAGRGYYRYKDDGHVYDLTIQGNSNFLTQRLALRRIESATDGKTNTDVRAHPVYVGNCVKVPMFSFTRLQGADPVLRVEMASTGEVACFGRRPLEAFLKGLLATGMRVPQRSVLLAVGPLAAKIELLEGVRALRRMGFSLYATKGTAEFYKDRGIDVVRLFRNKEKRGSVVSLEGVTVKEELKEEAIPHDDHARVNILTAVKTGVVELVINIPNTTDPVDRTEGYHLRRTAVDYHVSLITNIKIATMFIDAIEMMREPGFEYDIRSYDEYMRESKVL